MASEKQASETTGSKQERRTSRISLANIPSMSVHPSYRTPGQHPSGYFRTFGNPLPIGFTAHAVGCLVYGSFVANWRNVSTPLVISAVCLSICSPGAFLASILCFICDETFFSITFMAISGLWGFLGLAYLPVTGILEFYSASPETGRALQDSIALVVLWYGVVAVILGLIVSRRNLVFPAILFSSGISLFILSATYFMHEVSTSTLSKVAGYFLVVSGLGSAHYVVAAAAAAESFPIQLPMGHMVDPKAIQAEQENQFGASHLGQRHPAFHNAADSSDPCN